MTVSTETTRWSLQDLLPGGAVQMENRLDQIETCVQKIESYRPQLSTDLAQDDFLDLLHAMETLRELTAVVAGYAYLRYAENTQDPAALSLRDRIEQILAEVDNRTMFFSLWFKSLADETAGRYISISGDLQYYLEALQRFKPYTLSEPEEKIINLKDVNGCQALVKDL